MALLLAVLLAFFVLPWPWGLIAIAGGLAVETVELTWGLRLARRWKPGMASAAACSWSRVGASTRS